MSTTNDGSTAQCGCRCGCGGRRFPLPRISTVLFIAFLVLTPVGWFGTVGSFSDAAASTTRGVKQNQQDSSNLGRGSHTHGGDHPRASSQREADPVIEEVTAKQLERLLNEKDFVAVYWCKCLLVYVQKCIRKKGTWKTSSLHLSIYSLEKGEGLGGLLRVWVLVYEDGSIYHGQRIRFRSLRADRAFYSLVGGSVPSQNYCETDISAGPTRETLPKIINFFKISTNIFFWNFMVTNSNDLELSTSTEVLIN